MRKTKVITIPGVRSETPGERDNGKSFLVKEMASRPAEKWAERAFLAIARAGADLPPGIGRKYGRARGNMQEISRISSMLGHLNFPELDPLIDELMGCVSVVLVETGDQMTGGPVTRPLRDIGDDTDDIEEISTRHLLRSEVINLHVGFLLPAAVFSLLAVGSMMTEISTPESWSNTQTSRRRSRLSSVVS